MSLLPSLPDRASLISSPQDPNLPGVALLIAHQATSLLEALEPLKGLLRERAKGIPLEGSSKRVVIPALLDGETLGEVTATFQRDRVSLVGDPLSLKSSLGEDVFSLLFEEKISYSPRREILSLLENLPSQAKKEVLSSLDVSKETIRIGFHAKNSPSL